MGFAKIQRVMWRAHEKHGLVVTPQQLDLCICFEIGTSVRTRTKYPPIMLQMGVLKELPNGSYELNRDYL